MNRLIILGASGHGKVVADIALKLGYRDVVFLDDDPSLVECTGLPVIGPCVQAASLADGDTAFFVAIGNPSIRERVQESLRGFPLATLVHPDAVISRRVKIGAGTVVMAGAVVNSDTVIGDGCIVNTGATVDHDNRIADYVHISVGAHTAGTVGIGRGTWVGIGVVVSNNVDVCAGCMIGAGAVVVRDITVPGTYVGVPARLLREGRER